MSRTKTVRLPPDWKPSQDTGTAPERPSPSEAMIAESRTVTEKLPTVKETP